MVGRLAIVAMLIGSVTACSSDVADTATGTDSATVTSTTVPVVTSTTTSEADYTFGIENFAFVPEGVTVSVGETVTWRNLTPSTTHTVTSPDDAWVSQTLGGGETFSVTFDQPGTYGFFCTIHPSMVGAVEVVDG